MYELFALFHISFLIKKVLLQRTRTRKIRRRKN